jgi:hypothetical protein
MHRYKILNFKIYGLKYTLKYTMQVKLFELKICAIVYCISIQVERWAGKRIA